MRAPASGAVSRWPLDRTDYRLQLREAEARLRQLEADLARKRTLPRAFSPAAIEALEANTVAARVARDSAQRDLDQSTLNAPFDGVVARRLAEPDMVVAVARRSSRCRQRPYRSQRRPAGNRRLEHSARPRSAGRRRAGDRRCAPAAALR